MDKARTCAYQANYHLIWATRYRRKVLDGSVKVRLEELLKMIAEQNEVVVCWLPEFMIATIACVCLCSAVCVYFGDGAFFRVYFC